MRGQPPNQPVRYTQQQATFIPNVQTVLGDGDGAQQAGCAGRTQTWVQTPPLLLPGAQRRQLTSIIH